MAIVTRETGESENFTCFFSASCKYVLLVYITYLIGGGGTILSGRAVIKWGIWSVMHLLMFI